MADLRKLADDELASTVLRIRLDITVNLQEFREVEAILAELKGTSATHGKAGVLAIERSGLKLEIDAGDPFVNQALPEVVNLTAAALREMARTRPEAKHALVVLQKLLHEAHAGGC
ncbi:MAG TPA: hypothetical protein VGK48_19590 [Terriglobia bacterium]|jgi:hypothetical protein